MEAGRIGPNAILQLVDVLERRGEGALLSAVLSEARVQQPARDAGMLPEADCAAVHQALRRLSPLAEGVLEEAGFATGDYILANRIPRLAQAVLRVLPGELAARVLTKAIAKHSWTFAGTGEFRVESVRPLVVSVARNPLVAGWQVETPQCIWHVAVFRRLYGRLVWPSVEVREVACCACGDAACRFRDFAQVAPQPPSPTLGAAVCPLRQCNPCQTRQCQV